MLIISFLSIHLLIGSTVDFVLFTVLMAQWTWACRCVYENKFIHQNLSIIRIVLSQNSFNYGIYFCWFMLYKLKPCVGKHLLTMIQGLGNFSHTEKKYEKHTTMKRKYKLPNLQPCVLTYSFNPSRWNTNEAKYLQRQPSLYREFHASRVTLWKPQLAKVERECPALNGVYMLHLQFKELGIISEEGVEGG